jgi:hypothetical protein
MKLKYFEVGKEKSGRQSTGGIKGTLSMGWPFGVKTKAYVQKAWIRQ